MKKTLIALRGGRGLSKGIGGFRWSPAVKAFALLFVSAVLENLKGDSDCVQLSGEDHGPAVSLDYALSKQPGWLFNMLGQDAFGNSLARRFISRHNPERKRPGPVSLGIDETELSLACINLFVDQKKLASIEELTVLQRGLLRQCSSSTSSLSCGQASNFGLNITGSKQNPESPSIKQIFSDRQIQQLRSALEEELRSNLRSTNIFCNSWLKSRHESFSSDPALSRLGNASELLNSPIDLELLPTERLGIDAYADINCLNPDKPIKIAVSPNCIASVGLLSYMRDCKKIDLDIDYTFAHSPQIINQVLNGSNAPDALVLGLAPALKLANIGKKSGYRPLMIMPQHSRRIVAKKSSSHKSTNLNYGSYAVLNDLASTSGSYFAAICGAGIIEKRKVTQINCEPAEFPDLLVNAQEQMRAVMVFPHYMLNVELNGCILLDDAASPLTKVETVLFLREDRFGSAKFAKQFNIAVRNAWIELLSKKNAVSSLSEKIISDYAFMNTLTRIGGFHHIAN